MLSLERLVYLKDISIKTYYKSTVNEGGVLSTLVQCWVQWWIGLNTVINYAVL